MKNRMVTMLPVTTSGLRPRKQAFPWVTLKNIPPILIILCKYVGFLLNLQYLCTLKKENGHKERPNGNNSNTASALS